MRTLYSHDAEQAVLGGLLIDPERIDDVLEVLTPEAMGVDIHKTILAAITNLHAQRLPVDVVTLVEFDNRLDLDYLIELAQSTPSSSNILIYAKAVNDRFAERQLYDCACKIQGVVMDADLDTEERITQAQALFTALSTEKEAATRIEIRDSMREVLASVERRFEGKEDDKQILSGYAAIDKRIKGFRGGNLIIVGARPGMGKTTYGMGLVKHAAQKYGKTLVFSLEMPHAELTQRLVSSCGQAELDLIRNPKGASQEFWAKFSAGTVVVNSLPIVIDDKGGLSIVEMTARARREHRKSPVRMIMVDYIQLMTSGRKSAGDNRNLEVGIISQGLKNLAKELGCPVVALSQLNRGLESRGGDKRPMPADLRDSGSLEQDADIIQFLYRDEIYHPDSDRKGVMEINTAKFRDGQTGTDYLEFKGSTNTLLDKDFCSYEQQIASQPKKAKFAYGVGV